MSKREAKFLVEDMRAAMGKIARYIDGMSREDFLLDERTVDAVVRNLEIIGEAAKQLPSEYRARSPGIPWTQMAGMRNRIVHDYAGVDLEIVWEVVTKALPDLERMIVGLEPQG
ncbi:MAG: DUF86 domain-containing protein [Verrucomicrobiae bacterium]|nr:DUF86 domain-containing protein [Verrucomicrobiae bacterium]